MLAAFLLALTPLQLDVVRDALATVGQQGCGHFGSAQDWWGNKAGTGEYGNMIRARLDGVSAVANGLQARRAQDAPERARVAWDLAASIRLAQAARRLKQAPDYAAMPRLTQEPAAHLDMVYVGEQSFVAPLDTLRDPPVKKRKPESPAVPALFPIALDPPKRESKTRALKKKKAKQS